MLTNESCASNVHSDRNQQVSGHAADSARRALLALLVPLMLVLFISNLDRTIVAAALPSIGQSLQDLGGISWVATGYLLTSAVTTLILGKLGDMYGRKKIFQVSIAIFLAGSALCGAAWSMGPLIAFRALQSVGAGGLNSLVMATIGDVVPSRQRSRYQAYLGIVATLALPPRPGFPLRVPAHRALHGAVPRARHRYAREAAVRGDDRAETGRAEAAGMRLAWSSVMRYSEAEGPVPI